MKKIITLTLFIAAALSSAAGIHRLPLTALPSPVSSLGGNAGKNVANGPDTIVSSVPDGVTKIYTLNSFSFYVEMGTYVGFEKIETAREAVHTDDAIYLQGPLGAYDKGTYMKAVKRDATTYVVALPCKIYSETFMDWETQENVTIDYDLRLMEAIYDEEGNLSGYAPTDDSQLELTVSEGSISIDLGYVPTFDSQGQPSFPEKILGLCANGFWAGYGDAGCTWTVFEDQVATPPAGTDIENWVLASDGEGMMVKAGFHGDEIWIGNLVPGYIPDSWVRGKINGDRISIESGQFMGIIESQFVYFVSGIDNGYSEITVVDSFDFAYDPQTKTIKADNPDMVMAVSAYPDALVDWVKWRDPSFTFQPDEIDPTPLTPFNLEYADWFDDYGYATFSFDESNLNAQGHLLDTSRMYYRIMFDGEAEEFGHYEYADDFPSPTTDIPFNQNSSNFYTWDITHQMIVYVYGLDSIGVQVINEADGVIYSSPVASLDLNTGDVTVGVRQTEICGDIESVEYYDLNGQRTESPSGGIYICRKTMSDGSVKTGKSIFRSAVCQ